VNESTLTFEYEDEQTERATQSKALWVKIDKERGSWLDGDSGTKTERQTVTARENESHTPLSSLSRLNFTKSHLTISMSFKRDGGGTQTERGVEQ